MNKGEYIIDFTNVKYYLEMHAVIKSSLKFPKYYGCNWDAFWDCLSDMYGEPVHIKIIGIEVIERKFDGAAEKMLRILKKAKHDCEKYFPDSFKIEILREDGTVTVVE